MGSDEPDDVKTVLIQKLKWLPPVDSVDDLPTQGVEEGTHCFVEGDDEDEEIWQFTDQRWIRIDQL